MSSLFQYLKREGLRTTVVKAWNKVFHHTESRTIFLRADSIEALCSEKADFENLTNQNLPEFEKIKFWSFIDGNDYIDRPYKSAIILKKGNEYIGYAAEEHEVNRIIHGLGSFRLHEGEGWIGPVYVKKQWRGRGFNNLMLVEIQRRLQDINIGTFFTSVNSLNASSLRSFRKAGFEEIGVVDAKGKIVKDTEGILVNAFNAKEE